jgi:ubiquinone biosynthesis protein
VPLFPLRRRLAEIARVRRIIEVLVRNGLGFLVEQLALNRFLPRFLRQRVVRTRREISRAAMPVRLRRTLEELGATYIKLGQLLSGRADILPSAYIEELSKLLDAAPPVPVHAMREAIQDELGAPVDQIFMWFDDEPTASASIGQVHRATLYDGQEVVVKIQRPGIDAVVEADLDLLLRQARFLAKHSETLRDYNVLDIAVELAKSLREELDYKIEGRNAERLRNNLGSDPHFVIPHVHWDLTTRRVITLEYLEGIQFNELDHMRLAGYDLSAVAHLCVEGYLQQIFSHGFYHADPHPANLMVLDADPLQIGFMDFGNAGYLTPRQKESLGDMFVQILDQDAGGVVHTIVKMGAVRGRPSLEAMERDVQRLLVRYWGLSLEDMRLGEMLAELFTTAYEHKVYLPGDLALLARTIITLEGTALAMDPDFVLVEAVWPFARKLVRERLSPLTTGRRVLHTLQQTIDLAQAFPRRIDDLWDQLAEGGLTLGVDVRRLEILITQLNSMVNRLAFSVLVAALIVGSSLILLGGKESWKLPILGVGIPVAQIAFLGAVGAGVWLLISMIRSRNL